MAVLRDGASMLSKMDRVIEVCPPDLRLARYLCDQGCERYLGLVPATEYAEFCVRAGDLAHLFAPMQTPEDMTRSNADVLIIHGDLRRYMWCRRVGDARIIAVGTQGITGVEARVASMLRRRRRFRVTWDSLRFDIIEQSPRRATAARHYASQKVGLDMLPKVLERRRISYVVLRWFDTLPRLKPGEDLDVLVADADLEALRDVLDDQPGSIPVDVYSETGRPGADFQSMAYYPPALAAGILERAVRLESGYWVPSSTDHFRSLAYHAVYHKGEASGLDTELLNVTPLENPDHDYARVLNDLAGEIGVDCPMTLEALDEYLAAVEWRPTRDALSRLSQQNQWVRARFFAVGNTERHDVAMTAFFLRKRAADQDVIARAHGVLTQRGWEVIGVHHLNDAERKRCSAEIRGGNWGPGPFPTSGGEPAVLIVALDDQPTLPTADERRQHPGLSNANSLAIKLALREELTAEVNRDEQFNPVHSSDGEDDAWHYIELAGPNLVSDVRDVVAERRAASSPSSIDGGQAMIGGETLFARMSDTFMQRPSPVIGQLSKAIQRVKRMRRMLLRRWASWRVAAIRFPE